jgi:predicted dehydrogenase
VTLRVGLVGCGMVARHHVPALRAARGAALVAAFDVNAAAAARTGAAVADSLGELIERVDVVAVCTPPEHHADVAVAALEAGRGVLVEKPLATTLADADRILSAGEGAMGFQLRCHRKLPSRAHSVYGIWSGPLNATVGPLLDRAVHHVDLWRALLGDEVLRAQMNGSRLEAEMLRGARPYVELVDGGPSRNEVVVDGRRIDLYGMDGMLDRLRHPRELLRGGPYQSAFVAQWEAIAAGRPPATLADGRRALEIVLSA